MPGAPGAAGRTGGAAAAAMGATGAMGSIGTPGTAAGGTGAPVLPGQRRASGDPQAQSQSQSRPQPRSRPGTQGAGSGRGVRRGGPGEPPPDEPYAPLAPIAPPDEKGSKGRAYTGIAAAAVTTVLAVVIAGQVATGEHREGDGGGSGVKAGQSADNAGPASDGSHTDTGDDERAGRSTKPGEVRDSYDDKMAALFPLEDDFEGKGTFATVGGHEKGPRGKKVLRYRVDVEKGLPLEGALFAEAVHKTLNDKRSWAHGGERSFERISKGKPDFVITLASPRTTDVWCAKSGLDTSQEKVSCDSAATERVMINAYRWARGAKTYGDDHLHSYRQMLINHEVGHRLGHGHVGCGKDGAIAPVMMQQTKYLTTDGATCRPNAWPHPRG
ncbi:DUF3152 domain-containing protein [Streptomyces albiaxialis]|uniref:DUF3152 domain-containing protein n=1 Tax=Streptomyces albiaxialis TaxID=329523 RepID=UPI0031D4D4C0